MDITGKISEIHNTKHKCAGLVGASKSLKRREARFTSRRGFDFYLVVRHFELRGYFFWVIIRHLDRGYQEIITVIVFLDV